MWIHDGRDDVMVRHWAPIGLFCWLLFLGTAAVARAEVKVIELQHRPASEMAAVLAPLLSAEGSVSAYGSKLILKGSARELGEMEKVVRQLDVVRRTLRLALRQSASDLTSGQQEALGGRIGVGGETEVGLSGRFQRTLGTGGQTSDQFLQVLDGEEGYLTIGREVPFTRELAVLAGRHLAVAQRTEFRQVSTGFRVRPQLLGDRVQLELTPHMSSLESPGEGGDLSFSSLTSRVVVPLGQWFNLGGHMESRDELSQAILNRNLGAGQNRHQVYIRVDTGNNQ